jgi:hypothetical protein
MDWQRNTAHLQCYQHDFLFLLHAEDAAILSALAGGEEMLSKRTRYDRDDTSLKPSAINQRVRKIFTHEKWYFNSNANSCRDDDDDDDKAYTSNTTTTTTTTTNNNNIYYYYYYYYY